MNTQPNPGTVNNVADLLRSMPVEAAADSLRIIIAAIRDGMIENFSWDRISAREFAIKFAEEVRKAVLNAPPGPRVLH